MADHGTVLEATITPSRWPDAYTLPAPGPYVIGALINVYGTVPVVGILPSRWPEAYTLTAPEVYKIAGTISEPDKYTPPIVGQLWPRGDLDAE